MTISREIQLGSLRLGGHNPLFLIAGPCVIESEAHARSMAERVAKIASDAGVPFIFKASYDKANRSSVKAFRGPGLAEGLRILGKIKSDLHLPILTDIHDASQAAPAAEVVDILQIPAFLSRQTDLLVAAAKTGRIVNVKKAQFLSPWDMGNVAEKIAAAGNQKIILTERGASFGYNNLVVDMRSFPVLAKFGYPVVYDVTHSVQLPGGQGHSSGGQPEFIEPLARAGVATGVDGIFLETHDNPAAALSDGPNALPLAQLPQLLARLDNSFVRAVDLLFACKGRVVVAGMGKSGLVGRKISATFSSTGTPSFFLHPAEALHGDLGLLARGDTLLAITYGGETQEILNLLEALKRLEIPIVTLTGNPKSTLAEASEVVLDVSVKEEACSLNLAPTASTTVAMAVGDALAVSLLDRRNFRHDDFAALHPAGRLGKKLLRVEHLMHTGDALPRVSPETPMPATFHEMSAKKLGMTTVTTPDGKLAGILTDGDLRRLMEKHGGATLSMTAGDCMVRAPQTIGPKLLASEALNLMEKKKITSVVVVDASQKVVGVVHLHDLWTLELI